MKNITIIEDDWSTREVMDMIFSSDQYKLTLLADGSTVFDKQEERPDLFIIDRYLSGADGLDLCRRLKASADYNNIPIIVVSAAPGIETLAREAGAEGVLAKPFRIKTIREMVARAVEGKFRANS